MGRGRKRKPYFPVYGENGEILYYGPRCAQCGEVKHADDFIWNGNTPTYCKVCWRKRSAILREDKEKLEMGVWFKFED